MNRAPEFHSWAQPTMLVLVTIGVAALFVTAFLPKVRRFAGLSLLVIIGGFLIGPAAWASSEVTTPVLNATLPQAGPRIGLSGTTFGSAAFDPDAALADFLRAERHGERWDVATTSAMTASGLIAQDDISVMAMGGFLGSDPATSVAKTAELVKKGEVRFFLAGGGFPGSADQAASAARSTARCKAARTHRAQRGRSDRRLRRVRPVGPRIGAPGGGLNSGGFNSGPRLFDLKSAGSVIAAVEQVCQPMTYDSTLGKLPSNYDNAIYDCQGHGDELAALG